MKQIVRASLILKWTATFLAISLPIMEAGYWISNGYPFLLPYFDFTKLPAFGEIPIVWENLTGLQKLLGFAANLFPLTFTVFSLAYLSQIFRNFQHLEIFEEKNAVLLKKSAKALLFGQLVAPLHQGILSLALTFYNPVGKRMITLSFGTEQLKMIAVALAIFLISWVLREGCRLQEETRGIV